MAHLMEQLVTYHLNATLPSRTGHMALPYVQDYLRQHKLITGLMGDLHTEVFLVIKKNAYTHDDIGGTAPVQPGRRNPELK